MKLLEMMKTGWKNRQEKRVGCRIIEKEMDYRLMVKTAYKGMPGGMLGGYELGGEWEMEVGSKKVGDLCDATVHKSSLEKS